MKKGLVALIVVGFVACFFAPSWAFDEQLAKNYEKFFADYKDDKVVSALGMVKPNELVDEIRANEDIRILDIRTTLETSIVGMTLKNTLNIPIDEVFKPENLAKIPKDKKLVVVCQKGLRAAIVATALRNIGFNNVRIIQGGMLALVEYLSPDNLFKKAETK
ncbi:MAG TPA: rhodanese-like domain-containing protein [Thermodesulfovibrionia bacterium]|nr:rhodanese-like domain-containing protein [Thermodesulfovibrionia bacterium]